jgi:hypothetical protein
MTSSATRYCYHCQREHPVEEMTLLVTKTGRRWRCRASIKAANRNRADRDAFGRTVTSVNQAEAKKLQRLASRR